MIIPYTNYCPNHKYKMPEQLLKKYKTTYIYKPIPTTQIKQDWKYIYTSLCPTPVQISENNEICNNGEWGETREKNEKKYYLSHAYGI